MIIRRNAKILGEIFDKAKNIKVFTLENYFIGKELANFRGGYLADILSKHKSAFLSFGGGNKYHLSVHGNLWYEFEN